MLQFAFNQIERASNANKEVEHSNLEKHINQLKQQYRNNYQLNQQNLNSAGGAVSFGSKLFVFVNSDLPNIETKDKDNFYKTDSLAEKIGNKSYVIDMGSDKANVFVNNIQSIKRKTSKKSDLLLPQSVINLSKAFDGSNADFLFKELKNKVSNVKFDRYVVINFGMLKNVRVLLSKPAIELALSETSATPSTFSPVNFNTNVKTNNKKVSLADSVSSESLSNFIKSESSSVQPKSTQAKPKNIIEVNSISQTSSVMPNNNSSLSNTSVSPNANPSNAKTTTNKVGKFRYSLIQLN